MDYMKIKDRDKRIEFLNNTHLKKGQRFIVEGIEPWWEEMGITEKEWNDNKGIDNCMVIGGKLYEYDDKICNKNEVVQIVWRIPRDMTYSQLLSGWVDCSMMDSPLYYQEGLLVENGFDFKFIKNTDKEINEINKPLKVSLVTKFGELVSKYGKDCLDDLVINYKEVQ